MNSKPLIGVILGSSRQGRLSEVPAHWIYGLAAQRQDLRFELMDVGHHPLPVLRAGLPSRWAAALERLAGFIVVAPEDDLPRSARHAREAAVARSAFRHKPVGFVGYGNGPGAHHLEQLRSLACACQMAPVRGAVHMTLAEVMSVWQMDRAFEDYPHLARAARDMLDELARWVSFNGAPPRQ